VPEVVLLFPADSGELDERQLAAKVTIEVKVRIEISDKWLQPALRPCNVGTILEKQQLHATVAKRLLCTVDDDRVVALGIDLDDINDS